MTTEQKAKAYDELLIRAKQIYNKENDVLIMHTIEDLFPELCESEDERIRKWCISHFRECFRVTKNNVEYQEYLNNKVIPWLEKQGEPQHAWSKEDEIRLNRICKTLWKNRKGDTDEIYQQEQDVDFLKSLKTRYTWKPSDEQIDALKHYVDTTMDGDIDLLYQDLKELKGE